MCHCGNCGGPRPSFAPGDAIAGQRALAFQMVEIGAGTLGELGIADALFEVEPDMVDVHRQSLLPPLFPLDLTGDAKAPDSSSRRRLLLRFKPEIAMRGSFHHGLSPRKFHIGIEAVDHRVIAIAWIR